MLGDALILWSVVIWGAYSVYVRYLGGTASPTVITAATLVWGGLLMIPLGVGELAFITPRVTLPTVLATVFLAIFAGALAYWLWVVRTSPHRGGRGTAYLDLLPLVAAISGAIFLEEHVGPIEIAGGVLIVAGVTLAARSRG